MHTKPCSHQVVNSNKTTQTQPNQKQLKLNQLQEHYHFFSYAFSSNGYIGTYE
jgi:hypothetical protein